MNQNLILKIILKLINLINFIKINLIVVQSV